jgi:hypothetical protein
VRATIGAGSNGHWTLFIFLIWFSLPVPELAVMKLVITRQISPPTHETDDDELC